MRNLLIWDVVMRFQPGRGFRGLRNLLIWDVVMRSAVALWILEVSVGYSGGVNTSVRMLAPSFVRSVLRLALASSSSVSFLLRVSLSGKK